MIELMVLVLVLLQVKHWYIDFVDQNNEEVRHKGIYLNWLGVKHSVKQGICTFVVLASTTLLASIPLALLLALFDFLTHYHIDWVKMNYGNRDIRTPQFWNHLGLDQMAHQLCYIIIAATIAL